jgi:hypothetical protein
MCETNTSTAVASPRRRGAQRGNRSACKHGLLGLGKLPKDAEYIQRASYGLRRELEARVFAARKVITLTDASLIDACVKWSRHGALVSRWLTLMHDKLTPDQLLAFSREIPRAATERHRCAVALGIDDEIIKPPWASPNALDAAGRDVTPPDAQRDSPAVDDAPAGRFEAQETVATC